MTHLTMTYLTSMDGEVAVSNQLYDLQQARYQVVLCLRKKLDMGAIRCVCSFMGEKYMHLYKLQNNISSGPVAMQLEVTAIEDGATLVPGEDPPVWLHTNLMISSDVASLMRVNTRTLAVEHLTLNCGNEVFEYGARISKILFLKKTHLVLLTGSNAVLQVRVYDMVNPSDPIKLLSLEWEDLTCDEFVRISPSRICFQTKKSMAVLESDERTGEPNVLSYEKPDNMVLHLAFKEKLLFTNTHGRGVTLYWQGIEERTLPQHWRKRECTVDSMRRSYKFCIMEEFVMAVRDDGTLIPLLLPEETAAPGSEDRPFQMFKPPVYSRYGSRHESSKLSRVGFADWEEYEGPETDYMTMRAMMDNDMAALDWQTSMVKVQEGMMVMLSSRNSLCTVFPVAPIIAKMRKFVKMSPSEREKGILFKNGFIATHIYGNVHDIITWRSSASAYPSYFGLCSKMAFQGSLKSLLTKGGHHPVEVCPEVNLGQDSQNNGNALCFAEAEGKFFLSRINGVIEVYRV